MSVSMFKMMCMIMLVIMWMDDVVFVLKWFRVCAPFSARLEPTRMRWENDQVYGVSARNDSVTSI